MIEKVNPAHPDKIADRIAGAIVDIAYKVEDDPTIAVEVLIGHCCHIIVETSANLLRNEILETIHRAARRIAGPFVQVMLSIYPQDPHLTENQSGGFRCGDNGIFRGVPLTDEQKELSSIAREIYGQFPSDGKYILNGERLIICQSNANSAELARSYPEYHTIVNPLGDWSGGTDVDTGATNRKLGSDMADSVTGGGLHGKDLSKADVSLNIYTFLKAQETGKPVELCCAIGDEEINGIPYADIVEQARGYIQSIGGFEKFAEWGLF